MSQTYYASSEAELAQHLKDGRDSIEISVPFGDKIIKIKAVGTVAWGLIAVSLVAAIGLVIASPATIGASGVVGLAAAAPAVGVLGASATISAISLGVAGGGIGTLNKLRKYSITKLPNGRLLLKK